MEINIGIKKDGFFKMIEITEEEYRYSDSNCIGYCISCGEEQNGCEPDACNYECETCGKDKVFGAAELLLMGELIIK